MAAKKSLVSEAREIQLAIELIELGARLQLLEAETHLSRERLLKLYKEIKGGSPPKGLLPFSTDWFVTWLPNIHASLFIDIHRYLTQHTECRGIEALVKSYRLYLEHTQVHGMEPVLGLTRAWTLVRFFDSHMLKSQPCQQCGGNFVVHAYDLHDRFICGLCHVPSRAGKTRKAREEAAAANAAA